VMSSTVSLKMEDTARPETVVTSVVHHDMRSEWSNCVDVVVEVVTSPVPNPPDSEPQTSAHHSSASLDRDSWAFSARTVVKSSYWFAC
jgi:hypothetical protein